MLSLTWSKVRMVKQTLRWSVLPGVIQNGPIILNAVTCVRKGAHTWQFLFKLYETGVRENEPHWAGIHVENVACFYAVSWGSGINANFVSWKNNWRQSTFKFNTARKISLSGFIYTMSAAAKKLGHPITLGSPLGLRTLTAHIPSLFRLPNGFRGLLIWWMYMLINS
jgi:hypothetical protein